MIKACSFGEIIIRLIPPDKNVFNSLPNNINYSYYGTEVSFLVNISNLGGRACFISAIPDNFVGHAILRQLDNYRINRKFVKLTGKGRVGLDYIEEGIATRASSVIHDRRNSSINLLKFEDYQFNLAFSKSNHYYISGSTLAMSKDIMNSVIHSARLAKEMGLEVSCDLNYNSYFWKYDLSGGKVDPEKVINDVAVYCDYLFFNEYDIRQYFNIDIRRKENGQDIIVYYQNLLLKISKKFPHIKIVAMLARSEKNDNLYLGGVLYIRETNQFYFSPNIYNKFEQILVNPLRDIIEEREAFSSALLYGMSRYKKIQYALDFAVASSVLKYTYTGDLNYATLNEINSLMRGSKFSQERQF